MRAAKLTALFAAAATALILPLFVLAARSPQQSLPTFSFGRTGGNIRPFKVTIGRNGQVTSTGPVHPTTATASRALRNGLAELATAEDFFTMPRNLSCGVSHPDFASHYITITAQRSTRTVTARGSCHQPFEELYAVLTAATGVAD